MLRKAIDKFIKKKVTKAVEKTVKKTVEKTTISIDGKAFPVTIHRELRNNTRFSLGKRGAVMRIPTAMNEEQQAQQRARFHGWIRNLFAQKESLNQRFFGKDYATGDVLKVGNREYVLHLETTENQRHSAKLKGQQILLKLSGQDSELHLQKAIKHLLSRVIAQDFSKEITQRVMDLNAQFFNQEIRSVNLKYNQTNWGSCSSKTNINLSTRLLFAPQEVIDYVIIHELSHLIEMNHSHRFWAIVANAMPDYQEKEKWLKVNGHLCDF